MTGKETYRFIAAVLALESGRDKADGNVQVSDKKPGAGRDKADGNMQVSDKKPDAGRVAAVRSQIESGTVNWERVVYTGSNHYVLQTLYLKFVQNGLDGSLPEDLTGHLKNIYAINLERNRKIMDHAVRINSLLRANGITPVFMKGAGNIADGLYSGPGERIMIDIDLLAGPLHAGEAARLLEKEGYICDAPPARDTYEAMKHVPVLRKEGLPAFVEIHRMPVNIQYSAHFGYETVMGEVRPAIQNSDFLVMSDRHKIIYNFMHSQLVHWGHEYAVPQLRELYDLFLLSDRRQPGEVLSSLNTYRGKAAGYLKVFNRAFGTGEPVPAPFTNRGRCYLLRHNIALGSPRSGRIIFWVLRAVKRYLTIPLRSLFDKNYRTYVTVRLKDPEWYERNTGVFRKLFRPLFKGKEGGSRENHRMP